MARRPLDRTPLPDGVRLDALLHSHPSSSQPETGRSICQILVLILISIVRQPVLIAASRCYLIQMLRSVLTCINGCSCWSPDEENSPRILLTMDALYRQS
jgi:hypothetical protein